MANRNLNKKVKMKNYIYGAGHYSNIITKELLIQGLKFDLVIDKYTEKTELHGIPIVNSAEGLDVNANGEIFLTGHTKSGTKNWDTFTIKTSNDGGIMKRDKHSLGYCFFIFNPPITSTSKITVFPSLQILSISDFKVP